jgi:hypothetical protein
MSEPAPVARACKPGEPVREHPTRDIGRRPQSGGAYDVHRGVSAGIIFRLFFRFFPTVLLFALASSPALAAETAAPGNAASAQAARTIGGDVNGAANIRAFGAVSSASILSCIADRGSPKLNCSNAGDYINGQYVFVPGGGATPQGALADGPDNLSVTSTRSIGGGAQLSTVSRTYEVTRVDSALGESAATRPVTVTDGSIMLGGDAWADVEWTCDSHALGYRVYGCQGAGCEPRFLGWVKQPTHVQVCGYDDMGFADASEMVAVGPNPASAGPYSRTLLGRPIVPRSVYLFDISRSTNPALLGSDDGSGNLSGSGISSGSIDYSAGKVSVTLNSPIDNASELWLTFTPDNRATSAPSRPTNDFLYATIASGGGSSNLSLNRSLEVSGSVRVAHDNGPAIRDALDSLINDDPKGGIAIVPKGRYSIGSLISIPDQVSLEGQGGGVEYGPSSISPDVDAGTAFVWNGPDNMSIFDVRNGVRQAARRFTIDARYVNAGASISTGLTGIHVDADCAPLSGGANKTNFEDLSVIQAHHGIELGGNLQTPHIVAAADVSETRIKQVHFLHRIDRTDLTSKGFVLNSGNIFLMRFTHNTCICVNRCLDDANSGPIMVDTMSGGGCAGGGSNQTTIYNDSGAGGLYENMEDEPGNVDIPFYSVWLPRTAPATGNFSPTTLLSNALGGHILIGDISSVISQGNTTAKHIRGQTWELDGNMAGGSIMPNLSGGADGGPGWTIGPLGGMTGNYYNGGVAVDGAVSAKKIFTQLNRLVVQAADGTRIAPMITLCPGPGAAAGAASDCWSLSYGSNIAPTMGEFGFGSGTDPSGYPAANDLIKWTRDGIELKAVKNDCSGSHVLSAHPPDMISSPCITGIQPVLCSVKNAPHVFSCNPTEAGKLIMNGTAGDTLYWWQG